MLTQEQIEKLKPLTTHPKYGRLLSDAIESWKIYDPISKDFGTKWPKKGNFIKCDNECCLVGAALAGKKAFGNTYSSEITNYFNISEEEMWDLISGFDCNRLTLDNEITNEAYKFGFRVRKIITGC